MNEDITLYLIFLFGLSAYVLTSKADTYIHIHFLMGHKILSVLSVCCPLYTDLFVNLEFQHFRTAISVVKYFLPWIVGSDI